MSITRFKLTAFLDNEEPHIEYGSSSLTKDEFLHLAEQFYDYVTEPDR